MTEEGERLAALLHAEFITHEMGKGSVDDACQLCDQRAEHLIAAGVRLGPEFSESLATARVLGLTIDELRVAVATADQYHPQWRSSQKRPSSPGE